MEEVGPLEISEIKKISFNFGTRDDGTFEAAEGTTLNTPTWTVSVLEGADVSPNNVKVGSPTIVGRWVTVKVQPGVAGCTYVVRVHVKDSDGLEHSMACKMRVVPA